MAKEKTSLKRIAIKDWTIHCPPRKDIVIKKGDNVLDYLPEIFIKTLEIENVIKKG